MSLATIRGSVGLEDRVDEDLHDDHPDGAIVYAVVSNCLLDVVAVILGRLALPEPCLRAGARNALNSGRPLPGANTAVFSKRPIP